MNVTCYPVPSKLKSLDICRAFARGCGGTMAIPGQAWMPGPSFFYGVTDANQEQWSQTLLNQQRHDFFYSDNSYFDKARGTQYRVTRNRLQHTGHGMTDGKRFADLDIEIKPWRKDGNHIVLCPQSDDFMRRIVGYTGNWLTNITQALMLRTERPLVVRHWNRDKQAAAATLHDDLRNAWALVTWSSAAAIEAILAGIPAISMGQCAARIPGITLDNIEAINGEAFQFDRYEWAGVLADNQWTMDEIKRGVTWQALNR